MPAKHKQNLINNNLNIFTNIIYHKLFLWTLILTLSSLGQKRRDTIIRIFPPHAHNKLPYNIHVHVFIIIHVHIYNCVIDILCFSVWFQRWSLHPGMGRVGLLKSTLCTTCMGKQETSSTTSLFLSCTPLLFLYHRSLQAMGLPPTLHYNCNNLSTLKQFFDPNHLPLLLSISPWLGAIRLQLLVLAAVAGHFNECKGQLMRAKPPPLTLCLLDHGAARRHQLLDQFRVLSHLVLIQRYDLPELRRVQEAVTVLQWREASRCCSCCSC